MDKRLQLILILISYSLCQNGSILTENTQCTLIFQEQLKSYQFLQCTTIDHITLRTQQQCQALCCSSSSKHAFSNATLNKCSERNQHAKSSGQYQYLIEAFIAGFLLIMAGICTLKYFSQRQKMNQEKYLTIFQDAEKDKITQYLHNPTWIAMKNHFYDENNKENTNIFKAQSTCTICLNKNSEAHTNCGHQYHIGCIFSWMYKNKHCPQCFEELKYLRVKCYNCFKHYFIISFRYTKGNSKNQFICQQCNQLENQAKQTRVRLINDIESSVIV